MGSIALPLNVTEWGVKSDKLADNFFVYFHSSHSLQTLYLGDGELVGEVDKALMSEDINFVTGELIDLLSDKDFMDYLESSFVF